ncbi:sensor histidine kinase [Bacillus atrophaeus]|uniref:HAMP domain-containing sensor histidine kinase n=1 Tax=Bacillus atrophaeus TaxID=1452 RepID=UPI00227F33CD|nr:HAMP domain-containing sensor histidine kinase [Bacillus atrophaeus]MCY8519980.1 HAMP domain-containing histidine kinase [Bacillus atrophaeus]MCY8525035.1 HAMP domain-containing histidine kinase [Bacillus atrophaeus]MEC0696917.1 HAMP domain-containing sensor histidine kinase [Bacillus atrophaeus]
MRMRGKFLLHFFGQMLLILLLVTVMAVSSFFYLDWRFSEAESNSGLTKATPDTFESWLDKTSDGSWDVDDFLKKSVKKQRGWLQIINNDEKTDYAYRVPKDVPSSYSKKELLSIYENRKFGNYKLNYWTVTIEDDTYLILFGWKSESEQLLTYIENQEKPIDSLKDYKVSTKDCIKQEKGAVYLLNDDGKLIDSLNSTKSERDSLNELELLKYNSAPWNYKREISFKRIDESRWMVASVPNPVYIPDHEFNKSFLKFALKALFLIMGALVFMLCLMTIYYSFRFGLPILHTIKWLVNLSKGRLEEPRNRKGRPVSKNKKGKTKQPYRFFGEIFESMDQLTETLKRDKKNREKIQTTREEWIAGLSHDLKTPLSTIYGYSMMLESKQYDWSAEEVKEIGHVVREKSEYMSKLIEDLNLTYRLKNAALPMNRQLINVVPFFQNVIEDFKKNPFSEGYDVSFVSREQNIRFPIDEGWFRRILENLLANAVKHNDKGTAIQVILEDSKEHLSLKVKDNGKGMDEETITNLFNRYYRGTNTKDSTAGTGLGLAIAKELVHLHNGTIHVNSRMRIGTVITLLFQKE